MLVVKKELLDEKIHKKVVEEAVKKRETSMARGEAIFGEGADGDEGESSRAE